MYKNRIQTWFIRYLINNEVINEDEKEIYLYGFEILNIYITIGICVTVWALYNALFYETIFFIVNFWIIRMYAGGLHFKSKQKCFITSIIVFGNVPILLDSINCNRKEIIVSCIFFLYYLNYKVCPVISKNKTLEIDQCKVIKKNLYKVITLMTFEINTLFTLKAAWLINLIAGSLLLNIVNILLGFYFNED